MYKKQKIAVIIPALNEAESVAKVIHDIPDFIDEIIVVDNGSTDQTKQIAENSGAHVLKEPIKGYGAACLKGIEYAGNKQFDILVFLDADYSDYPDKMLQLIEPIIIENYDFVIGSRMITRKEHNGLLPQAIIGNKIASILINIFWNFSYTDLGPFRAIKLPALMELNMKDKNYGWTVEMQIKAVRHKLKIQEIPVSYRKRIGRSKVTGTIAGTIKASYKILYVIFKMKLKEIIPKPIPSKKNIPRKV
jgi:glycosyltransferase involved in cell wall biosynthesis